MQALLEGVGPEGAVYASMGTLCNFGPEEFVAIGQALSALPNLVIWKLAPGDLPGNATVETLNLSSNVKVSSSPCGSAAHLVYSGPMQESLHRLLYNHFSRLSLQVALSAFC